MIAAILAHATSLMIWRMAAKSIAGCGDFSIRSGMTCMDAFHCRRRKPAEEHLPRLLDDIKAIADGQSQADPKFQTDRLFTRISAAEVRRQLIATRGYTDEELDPTDDPDDGNDDED